MTEKKPGGGSAFDSLPHPMAQAVLAMTQALARSIPDVPDGWDPSNPDHLSLPQVLSEVGRERMAQDEKWGTQDHQDGTGNGLHFPVGRFLNYAALAQAGRAYLAQAQDGKVPVTWAAILLEEVGEALVEWDPARLRSELVQVAAVAVAWIQCLDRNTIPQADGGEE